MVNLRDKFKKDRNSHCAFDQQRNSLTSTRLSSSVMRQQGRSKCQISSVNEFKKNYFNGSSKFSLLKFNQDQEYFGNPHALNA